MRTFSTIVASVAALTLLAGPVVAQGGPGRTGGPGPAMRDGGAEVGGPGVMMRNPATLVLEHADILELTDEQVRAVEALEAHVEEENGPRWARLTEAVGGGDPADRTMEERRALREAMRELRPVRREIRETNRAVIAQIHDLLTEEQEAKLRAVVQPGPGSRSGPRMRGLHGVGPVGAAYRAGFRHGMARALWAAPRFHRPPGG